RGTNPQVEQFTRPGAQHAPDFEHVAHIGPGVAMEANPLFRCEVASRLGCAGIGALVLEKLNPGPGGENLGLHICMSKNRAQDLEAFIDAGVADRTMLAVQWAAKAIDVGRVPAALGAPPGDEFIDLVFDLV